MAKWPAAGPPLFHATEQTAPSGCHLSSMGVCNFIYLHCLKRCGLLAASSWNLITSLVAFPPLSIWYGQPEHSADQAVWSLALTEIRCPCFIKETWTDLTGAGSRNADKDVTPKDSMGQGKSITLWWFTGSARPVDETERDEETSGQKCTKKKDGCSYSPG